MKTKIFNLIILDESGSMSCMEKQTVDGCNETIDTIIDAQKQYAETQEHFVSIYAFHSGSINGSHYLLKNVPATNLQHIQASDYNPRGCTPLFDAIGTTVTDLRLLVEKEDSAIGSVTIITDGEENSSEEYTCDQVAAMIATLKELGWNFNFIGANINVRASAKRINIDNYLAFKQTEEDVDIMFRKERSSRMTYFSKVSCVCCETNADDRRANLRRASENYFNSPNNASDDVTKHAADDVTKHASDNVTDHAADNDHDTFCEIGGRITPDTVDSLDSHEIFVFGSDANGNHNGGAALYARKRFGAVPGQANGLQGRSYAIQTIQSNLEDIRGRVATFVQFAKAHPELKFIVTRIGCRSAGFTPQQIAPLFHEAVHVTNISLPKDFWNILL